MNVLIKPGPVLMNRPGCNHAWKKKKGTEKLAERPEHKEQSKEAY